MKRLSVLALTVLASSLLLFGCGKEESTPEVPEATQETPAEAPEAPTEAPAESPAEEGFAQIS